MMNDFTWNMTNPFLVWMVAISIVRIGFWI